MNAPTKFYDFWYTINKL